MEEGRPSADLQRVTESFLESIGLAIDPATKDTSVGLAQQVAARAVTPSLIYLIGNGHSFNEETHKGEAVVREVLLRREALDLSPELVSALQERYAGEINWQEEAKELSNPTKPHPLRELNKVIREHLSEDAQKALAKMSF